MSNREKAEVIDISLPLTSDLPLWPGSTPWNTTTRRSSEAAGALRDSDLCLSAHMGTHIDAPSHYLADGAAMEGVALESMIGPAYVADLQSADAITAAELDELGLPAGVTRLLCKTRNSVLWRRRETEFTPDYVALTAGAASWVAERGIELVGVDYLSVQRYEDGPEAHLILLSESVVVVEGLDLGDVRPGWYTLLCLPLKVVGLEGAPARAVLLPSEV